MSFEKLQVSFKHYLNLRGDKYLCVFKSPRCCSGMADRQHVVTQSVQDCKQRAAVSLFKMKPGLLFDMLKENLL